MNQFRIFTIPAVIIFILLSSALFSTSANANARIYKDFTTASKCYDNPVRISLYVRGATSVVVSRQGKTYRAKAGAKLQGGIRKWEVKIKAPKLKYGNFISFNVTARARKGKSAQAKIKKEIYSNPSACA